MLSSLVAAVMLAFLPVATDMTNLHIAVPSLLLALGASVTEVLWIIDIYPLLIAGMLALVYSIKAAVGATQQLAVVLAVALLGLTLSIGLTASSIAIMGSVEASKGGAAGSLQVTAYELGTGLRITFFGVFMSDIFSRTISLSVDLAKPLAERSRIPEWSNS